MDARPVVENQRDWFMTGATLDIDKRIASLRKLQAAILKYEPRLLEAVKTDLGKSATETFMCEIGLTLSEITFVRRHLRRWARPQRKSTPLTNFPARSRIVQEPYGVVLVMSPWNYPVLLTLEPLVGAIAAGNCVVLKPSAYSPATSAVIAELIADTFDPRHVAVIQGGREENQQLLDQHFDYIFFTGGMKVGRTVMEKASRFLTPVTLELGGKSPVVVDHTANLQIAARRIVFGKFLNCGQTCIAPDYILVERSVHDKLLEWLIVEAKKMYGEEPLLNPDYGKIINQKHFDRLQLLMSSGQVAWGGQCDADSLRIAPTILNFVSPDEPVMQEEIFGPLLPIITVQDVHEAYRFVRERPHPLALYLFSNDRATQKRFMREVPFGGGCINDTIIHIATNNLPFGGVGNSGMGSYHGRKSFETFSHAKSVVMKRNWLDVPLRYQPYKKWKDAVIRFFLK